jgi:hypothetical protein
MGINLRKTILPHSLQTVDWIGDDLVDWASAGSTYSFAGKTGQLHTYHFGYRFDAACSTEGGRYVFLYEKLGTKGLLLKDGEILREINRSYYQAHAFEYPACFARRGRSTYLIHCPDRYDILEFEEVETGKVATRRTRKAHTPDFFHSRLQVSPDGKRLLSRGWVWHPQDMVQEFAIADCLSRPELLDKVEYRRPNPGREINTACFIDADSVLLGAAGEEDLGDDSPPAMLPNSLAIWRLTDNSLSPPVSPKAAFGNLTVIDGNLAWDTFGHPKIIDYRTGETVAACEEIDSGRQRSSILLGMGKLPRSAFSADRRRLAIAGEDSVAILSLE